MDSVGKENTFEYDELIRQFLYYNDLADIAAYEDKFCKAKLLRHIAGSVLNTAIRIKK